MNGLMGLLGNCRVMCWIIAALIGVLALVLCHVTFGLNFWLALVAGLLVAGASAYLLPSWFCDAEAEASLVSPAAAGSANADQAGTASAGDDVEPKTDANDVTAASDQVAKDAVDEAADAEDSASADSVEGGETITTSDDHTANASEDTADQSGNDDEGDVQVEATDDTTDEAPAAEVSETSADVPDRNTKSDAVTSAASAAGEAVRSGNLLAGEEDLAQRKGEWRYEGKNDAADDAQPASPADAETKDAPTKDDAGDEIHNIPDLDNDGILEGRYEGEKPETLTAARDGKPDNLKEIKGVGPKMERMLNELGFYHFDQIAGWSDQEVAWVDANLEGFKGRVSRDEWVSQAKILASGAETEFSKRVDKGDVY